jgi:hypothetical protein
MVGEDSSSPTISGGKHRRSPEATREESSKRRKHRHRHRHSHSHRHGRGRKEDDVAKPVEDEIEEGEILDGAQPHEIKLEGSDLDMKNIRVCFFLDLFSLSSLAVIFGMRFNRLLFHCSLITYLENLSIHLNWNSDGYLSYNFLFTERSNIS